VGPCGGEVRDLERQEQATALCGEWFGWRSGFLRCAAHGEAVSGFGRNDGFVDGGGGSKSNGDAVEG
jgi:hypothetical protein